MKIKLTLSFLTFIVSILLPNISVGATAFWAQINSPVAFGAKVTSLVVDPYNQNIMYVGTRAAIVGAKSGIYKTLDAGRTWKLTAIQQDISSIIISGNTLIAASKGSNPVTSLFRSSDGGSTWTNINIINTTFGSVLEVNKLQVDSGLIFALTNAVTSPSSVFKSSDSGLTWLPVFPGVRSSKSLAVDPSNPLNMILSSLFDGVFKSSDGGVSSVVSSIGLSVGGFGFTNVVYDPLNTNIVYGDGYLSTNGGLSWISNNLPVSGSAKKILFDSQGSRYVLSSAYSYSAVNSVTGTVIASASSSVDSVNKSTDGGITYIPSANGVQLAGALLGTISDFFITNGFMYVMSDKGMFKQSTIYTDMQLEVQSGASTIKLGEVINYSIKAINNGPDNATGVSLKFVLPSNVTFISATSSQGSCMVASSNFTCNLGSLITNSSATVNMSLQPLDIGSINNTFVIFASEPDPFDIYANNSVSKLTTVLSEPTTITAPVASQPSTKTSASGGCLMLTSNYFLEGLLMVFVILSIKGSSIKSKIS